MYKGRDKIQTLMASKKGQIAVLIDPEKSKDEVYLAELIKKSEFAGVAFFFIGGSTVSAQDFKATISFVKKHTAIPIVIFPGAAHQVSEEADAIL